MASFLQRQWKSPEWFAGIGKFSFSRPASKHCPFDRSKIETVFYPFFGIES